MDESTRPTQDFAVFKAELRAAANNARTEVLHLDFLKIDALQKYASVYVVESAERE